MATRENQGLQIALILFVMITVVLAVTTYIYYRKSEEKTNEALAAKKSQQNAIQERDAALFKVQMLEYMIGADEAATQEELETIKAGMPADAKLEELVTAFEQDMVTYGEGLPDTQRNYRSLPSHLLSTIQQRNKQVTERTQRETTLVAQVDKVTTDQTTRAQSALDGQKKAEDELMAERAKFNQDRDRFKAQTAEDATKIAQLGKKVNTVEVTAARQQEDDKKEIDKLDDLVQLLKNRIAETHEETFESPDGRVAWVNQRTNTVWINLGLADGLRPRITFSVYPFKQDTIDRTAIKARIEVTRVLDQHLAEARILEDELKDPILPGDQIYSPAWRPGRRVRFGLVGFMDIDGDGNSDRELVRNLITMNGGLIDAELHDDGTPSGALSVNTRYLVKGERPTETTGTKITEEYGRMVGQAERLGIQDMNLEELLSYMGWKSEVQTVHLGAGAGIEERGAFRKRQAPGAPGTQKTEEGAF